MTPPEYIQLKAFARVDGALLSLLWVASFACYIVGLSTQAASMLGLLLAMATPFFVGYRLRLFRDLAREGIISFMRSWAYVVLVFFYGSVLFSLVVYGYFAYVDQGYVLHVLEQTLTSQEMAAVIEQYGMQESMAQLMSDLAMVRPIDIAINLLTSNVLLGMVAGVVIAGLLYRKEISRK